MPCCHRLSCLLVVALSLWPILPAGAQERFADPSISSYRCYFKEPVPLRLDPTQIAVWRNPAALAPNALEPAVARHGIAAASIRPWPIAGWSLLNTPTRTASDLPSLVARMASDAAVGYVSPVFRDDNNGPLLVAPEILVGFVPDVAAPEAERILARAAVGTIQERRYGNLPGVYRLRAFARDGFAVLNAANALAEHPRVAFAEPDMIFTGQGALIPNDPGFNNCWGLFNTGQFAFGVPRWEDMAAPIAWDRTLGSPNILTLILDTGVQQDHPDIRQVPGRDVTSDNGNGGPVNPWDNHGTPVAGCVSAAINNGIGTVGIAPGTRVASVRTFISVNSGGGWTSQTTWTVDALAWGQSIKARVSNNSNLYGFTSSAIANQYQQTRAGMIHFASAGNDAGSNLAYPSSLPSVNAVAALAPSGALASFSTFGVGLDFSAPGQSIYTTDRTGAAGWNASDYVYANGTSFASPYAAGVAALVLSVRPQLRTDQVEQVLQATCRDRGAPGYDTRYGWGFVNAWAAVTAAERIGRP